MLKVKVFDEEHEEDLEAVINTFFKKLDEKSLIDIKFSTSHFVTQSNEQIYCYSCLILYREEKK